MMAGFRGDGSRSQPQSYSPPPAGGFDFFSDAAGLHPGSSSAQGPQIGLEALDLNSQSESWPNLSAYQEYLQSDGDDGGNDCSLAFPPPQPRTVNRTLGLRNARGTGGGGAFPGRGGGRAEPLSAGRVHRRPHPRISARGRPMPSLPPGSVSAGAVGGGGRRIEDEDNAADIGDEENVHSPQNKFDKANWSDKNNKVLCKFLLEQIALGNYNKGMMTSRGYKLIIEKYHRATNLRHDRKQISNRIRQLKQMFQFIKDLRTNSGLGRDENGWPTTDPQWWEEATEKHVEWKKLRWGPPEYLPELEQIFEGVAVDGSSSYVAGQSNFDDQTDPMEEEDEDDRFEDLQPSPMSSNSRKRRSSTSSTAESPRKKCKSPMVKMMKDYLSESTKMSAERNEYLKVACTEKKERRSELISSIMKAQQLALECGVEETSVEYYAVSEICKDECTRQFFINMQTPQGRLAFLKRYCRQHNLS